MQSVEALDSSRVFIRVDDEAAAQREFPFQLGGLLLLDPMFWQDRPLDEQLLVPQQGLGRTALQIFKLGSFWSMNGWKTIGLQTIHRAGAAIQIFSQRIDVVTDTPARRIAFRAREIDTFAEGTIQQWVEGWNDLDDLIAAGVLHREEFESGSLIQPQMAFFNLRLEKFQDPRVRQALSLAFDFETANERFFFDQYSRNNSFYINGAGLSADAAPTPEEIALLDEFREFLSDEAYAANINGAYINPITNGGGDNDDQLDQAS